MEAELVRGTWMLEPSGVWVGPDSGTGATVVYCVTITTGGGCCSDAVGTGAAAELLVTTAALPELDCSAGGQLCDLLGVADSRGMACD